VTRSVILLGALVVACLVIILLAALWAPPFSPAGFVRLRELARDRDDGLSQLPFRLGPFGLHQPGPLGFVSRLAGLAFVYLSWALLLFLLPARIGRMAAQMTSPLPQVGEEPGMRIGFSYHARLFAIGLAGLLAVLLLNLLGLYTLAGIPVAFALMLGLTLVAYAGLAALAFALGRALRRRVGYESASPLADLGLGALIVYALAVIPVFGWMVMAVATPYAFGVILVTRFGSAPPAERPWSLRALELEAEETIG
jgi:hypothetical protein